MNTQTPEAVKMPVESFIDLAHRHGFQTVKAHYYVLAKKPGVWVYADYSLYNTEKVTDFQAYTRETTDCVKMTYVWQLKIFFRTHSNDFV